MNYLNLTKDKIEQRLSSFEDMREKEVKCQVVKNRGIEASVWFVSLLASLVIFLIGVMFLKHYIVIGSIDVTYFTSATSFYVIGISFIVMVVDVVYFLFLCELDIVEELHFKIARKKVFKSYCEKYKIDNLEDDNSLQKVLISLFEDEFLDNKTDTEIYQHLYEHRMLRSEELDKIDKFLASNNINFRDYALALDSELLSHIINPYRDEIKREIEEAVASFFLEKDRTKQEEERAKSLERQKQNLFIEKTNGFASSMLGKNLAIQR